MSDARPTSIRIFLADGVPEGPRLVEKSNWTGRAVVVSRSQLDLESRLLELAKAANQWQLDNAAQPAPPPLNEADRADAEWFLAEMLEGRLGTYPEGAAANARGLGRLNRHA